MEVLGMNNFIFCAYNYEILEVGFMPMKLGPQVFGPKRLIVWASFLGRSFYIYLAHG